MAMAPAMAQPDLAFAVQEDKKGKEKEKDKKGNDFVNSQLN